MPFLQSLSRPLRAVLVGLVLFALPAEAQDWKDRGALYVYGVREVSNDVRWDDLDALLVSYRSSLGRFALPNGGPVTDELFPAFALDAPPARIGFGVVLATLNAEFGWQDFNSISSAELAGGAVRTFEVDGRAWTYDLGLLVPVRALEVGGFFGQQFTSGDLLGYATYPDGTVSFGDDDAHNGVWELGGDTVFAGLKGMLRLGPLALYGRAEWLNPFGFEDAVAVRPVGVMQETYGETPAVDSDTYTFVVELPQDALNFDAVTLFEEEARVVEAYDGFRAHVGLVFMIGG